MGIKEEFGKKLKRMRINRGLTQEELSEAANVSQRTLSGIETGENFVSAETIDKLVEALNTTTEELFSTDHLRSPEELRKEIDSKLNLLMTNEIKLEIAYKVISGLAQE